VIDNFTPQPYPLECSFDGGPWALVLGWQRDVTKGLIALTASPDRDGAPISYDALQVRYRLADTRPTVQPARTMPPARAPRRESDGA
jgi:hypothetical protein